jgi:hypothetical protein
MCPYTNFLFTFLWISLDIIRVRMVTVVVLWNAVTFLTTVTAMIISHEIKSTVLYVFYCHCVICCQQNYNRMSWPSREPTCLVFRSSWTKILFQRLLSWQVSCGFPLSQQSNSGVDLKLGHDHFFMLSNLYSLIILSSLMY